MSVETGKNVTDEEIEEVIRMLDQKTGSGVSRIGVHRVETEREDFVRDVHHHGRCDIGRLIQFPVISLVTGILFF